MHYDITSFCKNCRILIVDDVPLNIDILRKFLSLEGYNLSFATSGEKALKIIARTQPDLILLDIMMPGITGLEMCRILKSQAETEHIPIIFMTALSSVEDKLIGFEAGGVDYITKPIQEKEVLARVRAHLALHDLNQRLETKNVELSAEIAHRKKVEFALRKSEENYRTIFNSVNDAIFVHDIDTGNILTVNKKMCEMFGYTLEEVKNIDVDKLSAGIPPYSQKEALEWMKKAMIEPQIFEWQSKNKMGKIFWVEVNLKTGIIDSDKRLFAVVRDITERKKINEELEKAKESAEAANRAKSTFLAHMSHELRTPLNAILGFSQIMRRSLTSTEDIENIHIIHHAGEHLLSLINDILDMSKIEAGKTTLDKQDIDLHKLLNEVYDLLHLKAQNKLLEFSINWTDNVPQHIHIDGKKLRQVLINLLNNAIKFTEKGSVSLELDSSIDKQSPKKENILYFKVIDTGAGIAEDELDKVFKAFDQTATGRAAQEGTGLGLAISQKFIQMMGGNITIQSTVGGGTTFEFKLQVPVLENANIPPESTENLVSGLEANQPTYRILIVDDKERSRQILVKVLKPLGFELKEASNGQEALNILEYWQPHLIWMDIHMPVMDGYQATQKIKAIEKYKDIVIIALTTAVFEDAKTNALSVGCDDFLNKPFYESDIFNLMNKHLGVRYIYEKVSDSKIDMAILTPENLSNLHPELLENLEKSLRLGAVEMINCIVADIGIYDADLGKALTVLADDFKFREILTLVRKINAN